MKCLVLEIITFFLLLFDNICYVVFVKGSMICQTLQGGILDFTCRIRGKLTLLTFIRARLILKLALKADQESKLELVLKRDAVYLFPTVCLRGN